MKVSLFATCLVDQFYPEVGESVVAVLRRLGIEVEFPQGQTCCGQPAFNSGFVEQARPLARRFLDLFSASEYIVVPSGSCAAMLKMSVPQLFRDDPAMKERADVLAARTYEFSQFLVNVLGVQDVGARHQGKVTYHASCHLVRELGAATEAQTLIRSVRGIQYFPLEDTTPCCGFGGTFSVKYPDVSVAILEEKLRAIQATGAEALVSCDAGCLMQMAGAMRRRSMKVKTLHLAQLLAQASTAASQGKEEAGKDAG